MLKILIAEDEQRAREGMTRLLHSISGDYELMTPVTNGDAALRKILEEHPDVVFTDVKMPFLDGVSLAKKVREAGLKTEFVVISAYADFELAQQFISLDVVEYILKPVTRADIEKALQRVERKVAERSSGKVRKNTLRDQYPGAHEIIRKSLDMIESQYSEKISQREMAGSLGVSPEYFSFLFAKETGENFSKFLRRYRVEQAKRMYREGTIDRREIPYAAGFTDSAYFNKVFKAETGKLPAEFIAEEMREQ